MSERWRDLRLGDRVRIMRLPSGVDQLGYTFAPSTRRLYERLIASGKTFSIREIDQWGYPRIHVVARRKRGPVVHHTLALSDDSWEKVPTDDPSATVSPAIDGGADSPACPAREE